LGHVDILRRERDQLLVWLREHLAPHGGTALDSDANFILFGAFKSPEKLWQGLVDQGVLIRHVGPKGFLRVSVGTPNENEQFKLALTALLNEKVDMI
jgi:histidinol-phosphate aminotransferase